MKKILLYRSLLGAPIGVTVSIIITIIVSLCTGHGEYYAAPPQLSEWCGSDVAAVSVQLICSLAVGAIGGGSSVIMQIEKWSLTKQTLVHFGVLVVSYIPLSYILNWMPHNVYGALCYVAAFVAVYIAMWFSIYFSIRSKIKKMNTLLRETQQDVK